MNTIYPYKTTNYHTANFKSLGHVNKPQPQKQHTDQIISTAALVLTPIIMLLNNKYGVKSAQMTEYCLTKDNINSPDDKDAYNTEEYISSVFPQLKDKIKIDLVPKYRNLVTGWLRLYLDKIPSEKELLQVFKEAEKNELYENFIALIPGRKDTLNEIPSSNKVLINDYLIDCYDTYVSFHIYYDNNNKYPDFMEAVKRYPEQIINEHADEVAETRFYISSQLMTNRADFDDVKTNMELNYGGTNPGMIRDVLYEQHRYLCEGPKDKILPYLENLSIYEIISYLARPEDFYMQIFKQTYKDHSGFLMSLEEIEELNNLYRQVRDTDKAFNKRSLYSDELVGIKEKIKDKLISENFMEIENLAFMYGGTEPRGIRNILTTQIDLNYYGHQDRMLPFLQNKTHRMLTKYIELPEDFYLYLFEYLYKSHGFEPMNSEETKRLEQLCKNIKDNDNKDVRELFNMAGRLLDGDATLIP